MRWWSARWTAAFWWVAVCDRQMGANGCNNIRCFVFKRGRRLNAVPREQMSAASGPGGPLVLRDLGPFLRLFLGLV